MVSDPENLHTPWIRSAQPPGGSLMADEVAVAVKALPTLVAMVRALPCVASLMLDEKRAPTAALVSLAALIWLFSLWILWCWMRPALWLKAFPHSLQWYRF